MFTININGLSRSSMVRVNVSKNSINIFFFFWRKKDLSYLFLVLDNLH